MTVLEGTDILYGKEGPSPKQKQLRDASEKFKLFGGGVGGGKSVALCAEALRFSLTWPGNRGFMGRHEGEAFRRTTLVSLLRLINEIEEITGAKLLINQGHNQTKKELKFVNGSMIAYGGLGEQDSLDRIKSLEIGWFCVDEASETNLNVINMLKARLRWKLPNGSHPKYFGLFASNPEPGWLKSTFVIPQQQGSPREQHIFIQALLKDNPWLPDNYMEDLIRDNPKSWVKRYVEGSWEAVEGQVWPDFDFNAHVFPNPSYPSIEIPYPKPTDDPFAGLDHGQTNPTCYLAAYTDNDDNIYIYDEYYQSGLVSDHVRNIHTQFKPFMREEIHSDPSMWSKTREKDGIPWSLADEYEDRGIFLLQGNNNVNSGLNRVGEYLRVIENKPHPFLPDAKESPSIFISSRCRNLIREIPEYIWKKSTDDQNSSEIPKKLNDHACDALRYTIMSLPSPFEEAQKTDVPGSFHWYSKTKSENNKNKFAVIR